MADELILSGTLRLSEPGKRPKTAQLFSRLIDENRDVFRRNFRVDLFPGSLNIDVPEPPNLQKRLDEGEPKPSFVIPRDELVGMPDYIGDGQAWRCKLACGKVPDPVNCWIFRRIGSKVPAGVIEVVARQRLVSTYQLRDGDPVTLCVL